MAIMTETGLIPEHYDYELDNRDPNTTWLRLEGCHGDYVEVNIYELVANMVDNCRPWLEEEAGLTDTRIDQMMNLLAVACGQPTDEE